MMNMQSMMKQAQKLQKQMEKGQAELAATEFTGKSAQAKGALKEGAGKLTGDKKVVSIDFNPAVVDPEDLETLSEMTAQALNHALAQIDDATQKKMGAFAGKLPF